LSIGISCTQEAVEDNLGVSRSMEHLLAHTVLYHRYLYFLQQVRNATPWVRKARVSLLLSQAINGLSFMKMGINILPF
jgi:hypothetical protein